jgi:hypothetical protein
MENMTTLVDEQNDKFSLAKVNKKNIQRTSPLDAENDGPDEKGGS